MRRIIGICGLIGSGKNTVSEILVDKYNFESDSFARVLKDAVSVVFGWDRDKLEGLTEDTRIWRETKDIWWSERLNMEITPRWVLQNWGTEVLRGNFHEDIWIASFENRVMNTTDDIVISDVRFPNEIRSILSLGGTMVRVKRGHDPAWYKHAESYNKYQSPIDKVLLDEYNIHASEYSWAGTDFDMIINNDGTISDLESQVDLLMS
jgi:hypothetical protein